MLHLSDAYLNPLTALDQVPVRPPVKIYQVAIVEGHYEDDVRLQDVFELKTQAWPCFSTLSAVRAYCEQEWADWNTDGNLYRQVSRAETVGLRWDQAGRLAFPEDREDSGDDWTAVVHELELHY